MKGHVKLQICTPLQFIAGHPVVYIKHYTQEFVCDRNKGNIAKENFALSKCNYSTMDDNIDELYTVAIQTEKGDIPLYSEEYPKAMQALKHDEEVEIEIKENGNYCTII